MVQLGMKLMTSMIGGSTQAPHGNHMAGMKTSGHTTVYPTGKVSKRSMTKARSHSFLVPDETLILVAIGTIALILSIRWSICGMTLNILGTVTTGMLSGQNQSGAVLTTTKLLYQTVGITAGGVIRLKVRAIGLRVRAIGPKDLMTGTNRNRPRDRTTGTNINLPKDRLTGTNINLPKDRLTGTNQNRPKDRTTWTSQNTRLAPGALGLLILAILCIHGRLGENLRKIVLPCEK